MSVGVGENTTDLVRTIGSVNSSPSLNLTESGCISLIKLNGCECGYVAWPRA